MKFGTLYLIPTPIDEKSKLSVEAFNLLNSNSLLDESIIVVEDLKPGRIRWLNFGLNREVINKFQTLNEHNKEDSTKNLITELKNGKNVYLMSDGGLPAFCDPGQSLVYSCHKNGIKVTSTPFSNSVILALALSGLSHDQFLFQGFLPKDNDERARIYQQWCNTKITTIAMDTPYRLKKILEELANMSQFKKEIFIACDLNAETEELYLLTPKDALLKLTEFKREFILIIPAK